MLLVIFDIKHSPDSILPGTKYSFDHVVTGENLINLLPLLIAKSSRVILFSDRARTIKQLKELAGDDKFQVGTRKLESSCGDLIAINPVLSGENSDKRMVTWNVKLCCPSKESFDKLLKFYQSLII